MTSVSWACTEAVVLAPQIFINASPSLFCIIAMFKLIHSHLIAMIRLHLMLSQCSHRSRRSSLPHHGFLGDLINVRRRPGLPLWIYEISDIFSFNLSPPPPFFTSSCICPSIIPRADLGGRVLILLSHHSLLWTDEQGDGRRRGWGGQRVGDPQIGFHNIFKVLWGKDGEILLLMYADVLDNRPLGCNCNS